MIHPDVMTDIIVVYFSVFAIVFGGLNFIHIKAYGRRKTLKPELLMEHLGIAASWPLMVIGILVFLVDRVAHH